MDANSSMFIAVIRWYQKHGFWHLQDKEGYDIQEFPDMPEVYDIFKGINKDRADQWVLLINKIPSGYNGTVNLMWDEDAGLWNLKTGIDEIICFFLNCRSVNAIFKGLRKGEENKYVITVKKCEQREDING